MRLRRAQAEVGRTVQGKIMKGFRSYSEECAFILSVEGRLFKGLKHFKIVQSNL